MRKLKAMVSVLVEQNSFNYYEQQLVSEVMVALKCLPVGHPYVHLATLIAKEHCEQSERDDNWLNKEIRKRNVLLWKKLQNESVFVSKNGLQKKNIKGSQLSESVAGEAGRAIEDLMEEMYHENGSGSVLSCEFPLVAETPFLLFFGLGHCTRVAWFVSKFPMMMPVRETVVDFVTEYDDASQPGAALLNGESLANLQRQERYGIQRPFEHKLINGLYRKACASRESDDAADVDQKLRLIIALIKDEKPQFRLLQCVLTNAISQGPSVLLILLLAARHQLLLRLLPQISPRLALANVSSHPHWESAPIYTAEITREVSILYGLIEDMKSSLEEKNEIIVAYTLRLSEINQVKPAKPMSSRPVDESDSRQKLIQLLRKRVHSLQEEKCQLKMQLESSPGSQNQLKRVVNKKRKSKKKKTKNRGKLVEPSELGQVDNKANERSDYDSSERESTAPH